MKAPIGPTPIDIRRRCTSENGSAPPPWRAGACGAAARRRSAVARAASADAWRFAPAQGPARQGGGALPFSDGPQRRMSIGVGPMGAFIQM